MVLSGTLISAVTMALAIATFKDVLILPHLVGDDFRVFYTAAWMLRHGTDPYRSTQLLSTMARVTPGGLARGPMLFAYLPWFGFAAVPFSILPYRVAFSLWVALSLMAIYVATIRWARNLGWRRPWLAALVAAVSVEACLTYLTGQVTAAALGILVTTLLAANARRYGLAGLLSMAGALLKPQDLWLLVPLLWMVPQPASLSTLKRILSGQAAAALVLLGLPLMAAPGILGRWFAGVIHFAATLPAQTELVGLPGLLSWLPADWGLSARFSDPVVSLVVAGGLGGIGLTIWRWLLNPALRQLPRPQRIGWVLLLPLGIWLLATPYGHTQDMVVVFPLALLTLGSNGEALRKPFGWIVIGSVLLVPAILILFTNYLFPNQSLAPIGLLILVVAALLALRKALAEASSSGALGLGAMGPGVNAGDSR